jgi:hypothetical protein
MSGGKKKGDTENEDRDVSRTIKLSLCLTKHHTMKTYRGNGGEWTASCPGRFTPGTHWIGGWVDPRAGLDAVAKRKQFHHCACRELNPSRPARSLVSILTYTDSRLWNVKED